MQHPPGLQPIMRWLCLWLSFAVVAISALAPDSPVTLAKVRKVRAGLKQISSQGALPVALVKEAKAVVADADKVLSSKSPDESALKKVLDEYSSFVADLTHKQMTLTNEKDTLAVESQDARAAAFVSVLEAKLQKVLSHIKADTRGLNEKEAASRTNTIKILEDALATPKQKQPSIERALALHKAMEAAHDFSAQRTQDLNAEEKQLSVEIDEANVKILFGMLKQRAKLPMKSQVSILKRHQFANCSYAHQLLTEHKNNGVSLYKQLQAMLPEKLSKLGDEGPSAKDGHLAAAGSDGRVSVVSSRLKNSVKMMMQQLTAARDKLAQMADGNTTKGSAPPTMAERKQAKEIVAGLDAQLKLASKTNDLKTQLEIMDAVQGKMAGWAQGAATAAKAKSLLQARQHPMPVVVAPAKPTKGTQASETTPVKR